MTEKLGTGLELILNASEGVLQTGVTDNETPVCYQEWRTPVRATEILAASLSEMFRHLDVKIGDFRRIACVTGPGSFTGIRLVLSTAAALRRISHAQLAALDYMQSLAATAVINLGLLYPASVAVLTHAKRNLVHFQKFCSYGPQIPPVAVAETRLMSPAEALAELAGSKAVVCGSALARYPDLFALPVTGRGPDKAPDLILLCGVTIPSFAALCLLARHGDYFPVDLEPRYVRGCDAVDQLADRQGGSDKLKSLAGMLLRKPASDI